MLKLNNITSACSLELYQAERVLYGTNSENYWDKGDSYAAANASGSCNSSNAQQQMCSLRFLCSISYCVIMVLQAEILLFKKKTHQSTLLLNDIGYVSYVAMSSRSRQRRSLKTSYNKHM